MKSRLPQGIQGGNANMNQMVKKAQKMQEDITRVQEEIEQRSSRNRWAAALWSLL